MSELFDIVSSVGFPIFCCLYMIKHNNETVKELGKIINDNTSATNQLVHLITNFLHKGDADING